ncbi:hypothetical protein KY321_04745 [Candidatus Woesearchaeota archaeon]|nr:hypothetical protein [Candidatus Woesearchaeota archaeon]
MAYEAKGKTFEGRGEVELLRNHLGSENKYSIIKSLNEQKNFTKTILITFTENNEDDINIKIPFEYFEDNYGFACSFHNEVLRILFDEKTNYVDSVNILPTNSNSIIVELGNFENNEFVIKLFPKIMNKLMECGR